MSPTCMVKPKQSIYQHKSRPKYSKNKSNKKTQKFITAVDTTQEIDEHVYIELDIKCSCSQSNNHSSIQFSRRYLQCQSSMPIAILRSYIQQILPHSSMTQVSLFDSNHQLLQDSHLLHSLKNTTSSSSLSSSTHIPIRFTLFNTITSLAHCLCFSTEQKTSFSSSSSSSSTRPMIIKRESLDQTLSTCSFIPQTSTTSTTTSIYSPCLSSSSSHSPTNELSNSISIVNLLTPPPSSSSHSSFLIENLVDSNQSIIDEITSQFGEICPALPTTKRKYRNRVPKKVMSTYSPNVPLDLSLKKRSSPFDMFSSQTKWIKT